MTDIEIVKLVQSLPGFIELNSKYNVISESIIHLLLGYPYYLRFMPNSLEHECIEKFNALTLTNFGRLISAENLPNTIMKHLHFFPNKY